MIKKVIYQYFIIYCLSIASLNWMIDVSQADPVELDLISTFQGSKTTCVAIKDNYAFVGDRSTSRVHVLDIADINNPTLLASIGVPTPFQIRIRNDIAYVSCREKGLAIIDVSTPYNPIMLSKYDTMEFCTTVDVSDNLLIAANRYAGIELVDVSTPGSPQFISKIDLDGECQGVAINRDIAYISQWRKKRILIIDIQDTANPTEISSIPLKGYGQGIDIDVDRGILCAATGEFGGCGLDVFDITDYKQPVFLSSVYTPDYSSGLDIWSVKISGQYAIFTGGPYGVYIVSLLNTEQPEIVAHATVNGFAPSLALGDGVIFVCDETTALNGGLKLFEADGYSLFPQALSGGTPSIRYPLPADTKKDYFLYIDDGNFRAIDKIGDLLVAAAGDKGLQLIQTKPEIRKLNTEDFDDFQFSLDVSVFGESVFAASSKGLQIYNIDDENSFIRIGTYSPGSYRVKALTNDRTILAVNSMRIHVLDTTDPSNPLMIRNILAPHYLTQLCDTIINDQYACFTFNNGFGIVNLYETSEPVIYRYHPCNGGAIHASASDTFGYFVGHGKMYVYDLKDLSNIALLSTNNLDITGIDRLGNLTVQNSRLTMSTWTTGEYAAFSLSDPYNPQLISVNEDGYNFGRPTALGNSLIFPNGRKGLLFYNEPTVYEDAEDGNNTHWQIYDGSPGGATISNLFDEGRQSQVITLVGEGINNGYRLFKDTEEEKWENTDQFIIQWSMKFSEPYIIYIDVLTDVGKRFLTYKSNAVNQAINGLYVYYSLGEETTDGQWYTHQRDLAQDLNQALPDANLLKVNSFSIRGSGKVDDILLYKYNPTTYDEDGDGISNSNETTIYGTDPEDYDTDSDSIFDGNELDFWGSFWNEDLDNDGLFNLIDSDSDNDGYLDGDEISSGFDPASAISYPQQGIVYEDAEDGEVIGWEIYDNDPAGAEVFNTVDDDRPGRVIQFIGHGAQNGYRLKNDDLSDWNNTEHSVIRWDMKFATSLTVYVDVWTNVGRRYLTYRPVDGDELGDGFYVRLGLGASMIGGQWQSVSRDLQADLTIAQPGAFIESVNAIMFRGSGYVDNVQLTAN